MRHCNRVRKVRTGVRECVRKSVRSIDRKGVHYII